MAVKYHHPDCPENCGRRWVDWGAKKLQFKCPECGGELVPVARNEGSPSPKKPSLKRKKKKVLAPIAPPPLASFEDDDAQAPDLNELAPGENVDVVADELPIDEEEEEDPDFVDEEDDEDAEVAVVVVVDEVVPVEEVVVEEEEDEEGEEDEDDEV